MMPAKRLIYPTDERSVDGGEVPQVSFVLPVHNEEENLRPLHSLLTSFIDEIGMTAEIIIVDDASTDGSWGLMKEIQASDSRVVLLRHRRNLGEAASCGDGFRAARGDIVISMDADLQDDPREATKLLAKLEEGYDMVASWRFPRRDGLGKRLPSLAASLLQRLALGVSVHDSGSGLRVFRKEVAKAIPLYGGFQRFMPALATALGFRVGEVKVQHHPRPGGRSHYGLSRLAVGLTDLVAVFFLTRFAVRPIQWFARWALALLAVGLTLSVAATAEGIVSGDWPVFAPLLVGGVIISVGGLGIFLMGLLGELLVYLTHQLERQVQKEGLQSEKTPDQLLRRDPNG
jgi:glycosyltransferase involved in cell wall biosynthesis